MHTWACARMGPSAADLPRVGERDRLVHVDVDAPRLHVGGDHLDEEGDDPAKDEVTDPVELMADGAEGEEEEEDGKGEVGDEMNEPWGSRQGWGE